MYVNGSKIIILAFLRLYKVLNGMFFSKQQMMPRGRVFKLFYELICSRQMESVRLSLWDIKFEDEDLV
ncbi:hypothetical protein HanLR1_Chr02g0050681 [Helianthus annuus]|nr:hypothetical protein HanLR1_Chr02g0050681 [Helianthus annuus]